MSKILALILVGIFVSLCVTDSHAGPSPNFSGAMYPKEGRPGTTIIIFTNATGGGNAPNGLCCDYAVFTVWWDDLFLLQSQNEYNGTVQFRVPTTSPYSDLGVHNVTLGIFFSGSQSCGCSAFTSYLHFDFQITAPPLQALLFWQGSATLVNQSVTFYASILGGTSPYLCTWNFGDGMTGGGNPVAHTFLNKGNYTVTVTATDANAQTITASQKISVIALPKPVAGPPGPQGSQGPAGPPGPQGPSGMQGVSELPSNNTMLTYIALGVSTLAIIASVAAIFTSTKRRSKP